jgi:hypothetical protein
MSPDSRAAFGAFLDDLPASLYVFAHIVFLAAGLWLWSRATAGSVAHPGALLLYAASQLVFFAFFARWITLKMAVLVEQMLVFAMVCALVIGTF